MIRRTSTLWTLAFVGLLSVVGDVAGAAIERPRPDVATRAITRTTVHGRRTWRGTVQLAGEVTLADSATLTIAAGTRIEAAPGARLVVPRTARVMAVGTLLQPIVFTCASASAAPGCWDGVVIAGHAPVNGGTATSPAGGRGAAGGCRERAATDGAFGGCFVQDSSGVLRYVRVERAALGLQLLGVGNRTVIEDLQIHRSAGNGLEVMGGTVNLRRLVVTASAQYGLRWAAGWVGRGQQLIVQQDGGANAGGILGQNAALAGEDANAQPVSNPAISQLTVIAPAAAGNPFGTTEPAALRFERGTAGRLANVVLVRPSTAVDVDDLATCAQVAAGALAVHAITVIEPDRLTDPDSDAPGCGPSNGDDQLLVTANYTLLDDPGATASALLSAVDMLLPDLRPRAGGPLAAQPASLVLTDAFVQPLAFVGAVEPAAPARNNIPWYSGWTIGGAAGVPAVGSAFVRAVRVGGGGLGNATVRVLPSGQSATTGTEGGVLIVGVPTGSAEIEVVPADASCGAASVRTTLRAGQLNDVVVSVPCGSVPPAVGLALGDLHSCHAPTSTATQCWGRNTRGQLGDGTLDTRDVPAPLAGGMVLRAVAAGSAHTCGLDADGRAYCWGENTAGQLGDGSYLLRSVATAVPTALRFVQIVAGGSHSCGLVADGRAYCWGSNGDGEVGDGTTITRPTPVAVTETLRFFYLAAGAKHTCGIATSGGTWCWGDNAAGQLGDGTTMDRLSPTVVTGGVPFVTMTAGLVHTCGTTADGSVLCWGANTSGQLGTGSPGGIQSSPQAAWVALGLRHTRAAAGGQHSCVLRTTGIVACVGRGDAGQLGSGDGLDASLLVPALLTVPATAIATGLAHSCATDPSDAVWCWGANLDGQLGDGSRVAAYEPRRVGGGTGAAAPSSLSIDVVFDSGVPLSVRTAITDAVSRWRGVIVGDLPDVTVALPSSTCVGSAVTAGSYSIDDVRVLVRAVSIDGPGGLLGRAGPCYYRAGGLGGAPAVGAFTVLGGIEIDADDVASLAADGALAPLALHELGHVLGLGTFWSALDLVVNPATAPLCNQDGRDVRYRGVGAMARYAQMTGLAGREVPVEAGGSCATANVHWRESAFGPEVMTGFLSSGSLPLSRVTVGALEDLGFVVAESGADPFVIPTPMLRADGATSRRPIVEGRVEAAVPIRRVPGRARLWRVTR
ncbi:MAG: leishmanolysin-related zinc metalloendopeptidase [Gemmatimonadaceae bacterium]|nr:leishmanolysin-related zinc metalloendopeptidase [Gemmatimonadaceae bacterium]